MLRLQANIGASYDAHKYEEFLHYTRDFLYYDSSAMSYAQIASAYSCLYASAKTPAMTDSARHYMSKARETGDTTKHFAQYMNLIEYRLASGEILNLKQFTEKYPNGWTKN